MSSVEKNLETTREMKDSGIEWIGEIPKDWELKRLKAYIKYTKGRNPKELNNEQKGVAYIGASDLENKNAYYSNYTEETLPMCNEDDILILWDGARAGLIGYRHKGVIASTVVSISVIKKDLHSSFLYFLLKGFQKRLIELTNGTTIPHMDRDFINELGLPLPPLHEQQAIANYLDEQVGKIDELIAEQKTAIENWKAYKQSLITETVTKGLNPNVEMKDSGIDWIGEIPKEWKLPLLGAHFKERSEKVSDKEYKPLSVTKQGIVPQLENVAKTDNNDNRKKICINDFVINSRSDRKGSSGLSKYEGSTSNISIVLELRDIFPMYAHYLLRSYGFVEEFYRWGNGIVEDLWSTRYSSMKKINIPFPPLHEQQAIADFLDKKCSKIDQTIEQKQVLIKQLEEYKQSLIYECVTGKRCVL